MTHNFVKAERVSILKEPGLSEKWVQELIATDPSVLGMGDLILKDKERLQPRAGRLDLLLQDAESPRRYEVELQLGSTDETHIIRTIEYWDIERKRYPQYEHCAVIIAEDITTRFFNIISLFNGSIPLIAIQMQAFRVNGAFTLIFTKILDEMSRGLIDEDEEVAAPTTRAEWEARSSPELLKVVDFFTPIARDIDSSLNLNYNKHYVGWRKGSASFNFVYFRIKKKWVDLKIHLQKTPENDALFERCGGDISDYDASQGLYSIRLTKSDPTLIDAFKALLKEAFDARSR